MQLAMCTENHVHVKYAPNADQGPQEVVLTASLTPFAKETSRRSPALDNFYR